MKAFDEFKNAPVDFWSFIKFISEQLGYSKRASESVLKYTYNKIENLCKDTGTFIDSDLINAALSYTNMRADLLNNEVKQNLMDVETAEQYFKNVYFPIYQEKHLHCKLPLNKQKGKMKKTAYFTAIINILAENTIRNITGNTDEIGFDDDPHRLSYFYENNRIIWASSRRFDGAYPSVKNPSIVWEIKEYYYATSFGSRVADGVYETQLDGYEFRDLKNNHGYHVYHVLFVDSYQTWWGKGKSYLCRLVDALNAGLVDEIIVGREVLNRWPVLLKNFVR